ncbi:MAG: YggT family protein [Deltaproteobacteria bacterium]|jgi:YggT family protein|nr:YggT family protein [Deltaproteobacteria bacterium]
MFVMGNLLIAIAKILDILFTVYTWIIIAQAVVSWVRPDPYNPIVRFLNAVTEPVLRPVRRYLPVRWGGFDFSPLVVLLAIIFLQEFLIKSLIQLGYRL